MRELKVGQTIFLKPIGNMRDKEVREQKIAKVGNKYFEVDGGYFSDTSQIGKGTYLCRK